MNKKYIVRLSDTQEEKLNEVVRTSDGSRQKVRRANILLAANSNGLHWIDQSIAEAYHCRTQTVENVRKRFVLDGLEKALVGNIPGTAGRPKALDGRQEAEIIALRLGDPPKGYANWTLRLVAKKVVELEIADSISRELVRTTLKKRLNQEED